MVRTLARGLTARHDRGVRVPAMLCVLGLGACGTRRAPPQEAAAPPAPMPAATVDAAAVTDDGLALDAAPIDAAPLAAPVAVRPGWVDVAVAIPDAVLDLRYATAHNFTGAVLYPVARCLLRTHVAEQLAVAAATLRQAGFRLLLWDCYRPASIQRELWRRVPDPAFVARPRFDDAGVPIAGSKHSRGAAIDLGLADAGGTPLVLPTDHDAFGPAASGARATGVAHANHLTLRAAMTGAGFAPLATEWWHYDAGDWRAYPLSDDPLE